MAKKRMKLRTPIIASSVAAVLSVAMIVGINVANSFSSFLDVYFTMGNVETSATATELCENVAGEGLVLLKNEDSALPLQSSEKKIALLGQNSVDFVYGGSGSGAVDTTTAMNLKQSFEASGYTVNSTLWDFYATGAGSSYRKQTPNISGDGSFAVNEVPQSVFTDEVKNSLLNDDVAVVVFGRSGGESADISVNPLASGYMYLELDNNELDTLALACEKFNKVILLLNTNNPVELGVLEDPAYANVKAAMWIGGVGQEGIKAIPKIIKGEVNPSGRLVDTYAYDSTSAPSFANMSDCSFTNSTVTSGNKYMVFGEGIYVGYRYYETRYADVVLGNTDNYDYATEVQFPFGYGLSYTTFTWDNFTINPTEDNEAYVLSVNVTNIGEKEGKEVVGFYVQKPYTAGGVEVSAIELVEFAKTGSLKPNESEVVTATVSKEDLTCYDYKTNETYVLNEGDFYFAAGINAHDALNNILAKQGYTTSDGMTSEGDTSLASLFLTTTEVDATTYATSSVTGSEISNALDDVDVNTYVNYNYLSRADWEGTFPTLFENGSWAAPEALIEDLKFYDIHNDTSDDEEIAAADIKFNSTTTNYKVDDLKEADFDDPRWDDLVNQLSYKQQTKLIRMGGYATQQIDRINLPGTQNKDGPSGISGTLVGGVSCMAWPAEIVMASTWNKPMMEEVGKLFGEDSIKAGVAGVYGPGANIHRSPYSGRNFEYYSEDPILSYKIAENETKGLRSRGVIAFVKHFALNDQETNRLAVAIFANEQAVREIFLKGFEGSIVGGGANALMTAMNRVGARWSGAHKGLMDTILRQEWGFEGFAVTDQASYNANKYQDIISGIWAGTSLWLNTFDTNWTNLNDYQNDETVCYYIHKAAKNIIYGVVNSWAVNEDYKGSITTQVTIFPWRALIWSVGAVIWAASAFTISFTVIKYIQGKKTKRFN